MEDLIWQIVETDTALRTRVADEKEKLLALKTEHAETDEASNGVRSHARQQANSLVESAHARASAIHAEAEAEYQKRETALRRVFEEHRAEWVHMIADNCTRQEAGK